MARAPLRHDDPARVGRYRLTARLGAGGMGVVYLAEASGGRVAVKVLRPELADDPELRQRFAREVATLTRVRGVCTVRVIEADTEAARPYLVTEYAEGPSLAEYTQAYGPLRPGMLYGLAAGLAEALTAIHAAGVAHRDLKPSNVMLAPDGPKVIDFGIAQLLDATSFTQTDMTVGSAGFMAPEQITGRAGTAADVFSWGVAVGYAASGRSPFGAGTSHVIMYRILHAEPEIDAVPPLLRPHVAAALAKEPRDRPAAPELLGQLTSPSIWPHRVDDSPTQAILLHTWRPASTPPTPEPPRPQRPKGLSGFRRRPLLALAVVAAAAAAVLGLMISARLAPHPAATLPIATLPIAGLPTITGPATGPPARKPRPAPARRPAKPRPSPPAPGIPLTPLTPPTPQPRQTTDPTAASAALPVLTVGAYSGVAPKQIDFGLGQDVTGIDWTSWTATGATGYGRPGLALCLGNCRQRPARMARATIVLSAPAGGRFTRLTETRHGFTRTYSYPTPWPQSAS